MRNLGTVIDSIIAIAPELSPDFVSVKESIRDCSPERLWWNEVEYILGEVERVIRKKMT